MIYFLMIYAVLKLYILLDIYQQAHYSIKEYGKYFLSNILFYDGMVLLAGILGLSSTNLAIQIACGCYIILYSLFYFAVKVKLVFSKRIIRLAVILICFILAAACIPYIGGYLLIFIEFACILLFYPEQILSGGLNKKYITSAKKKLKDYPGQKIIITGSYGKTSTKLLFQQVLNVYSQAAATPKSYNTPLGISKFINAECIELYPYLVLEYGASGVGDIRELCRIAQPDVGVVCEIGFMHMNGFKTIQNVIEEKMSLVSDCRVAVLNYDNEYIRRYPVKNEIILSYGLRYGDYNARNIDKGSFDFYYKNQFIIHFSTSLVGRHQILNLLAALSYAHYQGFDLKKLSRAIRLFHVESNRLELKKIGNRIILDDSFNSNLKGFTEALKELGAYSCERILITPGIVELGSYQKVVYQELIQHIAGNTDIVILVGYRQCRLLYEMLKGYNLEVFIVDSFREGYALYTAIVRNLDLSALLIENDLPDLYKRGLRF